MGKREVETIHGIRFIEDGWVETEWTAKIKTKPLSRQTMAEELGVDIKRLNNFVRKERKKCQSNRK